jgi:hypothetical protein
VSFFAFVCLFACVVIFLVIDSRADLVGMKEPEPIHVLVTGSLYVVGAYLEVLEFSTDYKYAKEQQKS